MKFSLVSAITLAVAAASVTAKGVDLQPAGGLTEVDVPVPAAMQRSLENQQSPALQALRRGRKHHKRCSAHEEAEKAKKEKKVHSNKEHHKNKAAHQHKHHANQHANKAKDSDNNNDDGGKKKTYSGSGNTNKYVSSSPSAGAKKLVDTIKVTYYEKHDLLAPSCGTGSWNPSDNSYIGAVGHWPGGPDCGEFMNICNPNHPDGQKCLTVRVIDQCAGCAANHIDLTKAAFKVLSPSGGLDEGVVDNLKLYKMSDDPSENDWDTSLFGPFKLGKW